MLARQLLAHAAVRDGEGRRRCTGQRLSSQLVDPPLKETPLGLLPCKLERAAIGGERFLAPAYTPKEVGARGVEKPVVVEVTAGMVAAEDGEGGLGSVASRGPSRG